MRSDDGLRDSQNGGTVGMRSEEAVVGKIVRVRQGHRKQEFHGVSGVIKKRYGAPDYVALEVELGDGRNELFWHHELEDANGAMADGTMAD
jgi:hypothetical protein